jgi:hypothetical protein
MATFLPPMITTALAATNPSTSAIQLDADMRFSKMTVFMRGPKSSPNKCERSDAAQERARAREREVGTSFLENLMEEQKAGSTKFYT